MLNAGGAVMQTVSQERGALKKSPDHDIEISPEFAAEIIRRSEAPEDEFVDMDETDTIFEDAEKIIRAGK
ncbi:MAG: hypothetical protein AAF618_05730 [Pseudomonadota bacterium]